MQVFKLRYMYGFIAICHILFLSSCDSVKQAQRYYYDFEQKKLLDKSAGGKEVIRPLPYRATKDIQVEVSNYNPLKYELIIEDSSSQRSIGDTATLARFVVFPKTLSLAEGDQKNKDTAAKKSTGFLSITTNDCEMLEAFIYSFNLKKDEIESLVRRYKELMLKMEIIGSDYEYLKRLVTLSAGTVGNRVDNSFLNRLKNFLLPAERAGIGVSVTNTSSNDLAALETLYFTAITNAEDELDQVKADADKLKGACANFFELYKKFNTSVTKVKDNLRDFKTTRLDKIVPAFNKKLQTYDELVFYNAGVGNYTSKAVPITKDKHTILIYKKEGDKAKVYHDEIRVDPTRGIKLDVAGGVFASGLNDHSFTKKTKDSIYTKQYLLNGGKRDTTLMESFSSIYKREQSSISYGGMLYLQLHSQNAAWINWGGYIGFGAMFNDQTRWAGAGGFSLQLGKPQQFNINAGAIIGQVERLAPPYQTNTWYAEKIDNIPTYKAWDVSWMVGFSWSFR